MNIKIRKAGYESGITIIENIVFSIDEGEMVGLIGTNGAGKSTTIKSIMGTIPWVEGEIFLPETYAYIPEQPIYYEYLTLSEHFDLIFEMKGIKREEVQERLDKLLEEFSLAHVQTHYISAFSKGMKQKAMILFALIQQPELYIVDEPFVGLDAMATIKFIRHLQREQQRGARILLCTHVIDTAEKLCSRFVWIDNGNMLVSGTKEEIQQKFNVEQLDLLEIMEKVAGGE
ncbi:MAG: ABC transporter ATP-binding protein [Bacillaceae bacterium]